MPMVSAVQVLRHRVYGKIFLLIAIFKFGFLFFLPNSPSSFAPDEGAYTKITYWFSLGKDLSDPASNGIGLYESSRALIIPAGFLHKLGVPSLEAVRIVSTTYGLLSILIIILLLLNFSRSKSDQIDITVNPLLISATLIYAFLPSHFLWSELGLRESASEFWILSSAYLILRLNAKPLETFNHFYYVFITFTIVLAFGSRKQTAMVFLLAVIISQFLFPLSKKTFFMIGTYLISGIFGFIVVATPVVAVQKTFELRYIGQTSDKPSVTPSVSAPKTAKPLASKSNSAIPSRTPSVSPSPSATQSLSPTPSATQSLSPTLCHNEGEELVLSGSKYVCELKSEKEVKSLNPETLVAQIPSAKLSDLQNHFELNRVGAESALAKSGCNIVENELDHALCLAKELPYRITSVLFRPLYPFDQGSLSYNLASLENYIWIMLILLLILDIIKSISIRTFDAATKLIYIYSLGFIVSFAIYEGNLGTAFRHKSSILWCLIFVAYNFIISSNRQKHSRSE